MPEFFLELFSEEIPARMQAEAAEKLFTICWSICGKLSPENFKTFYGPRRIAVSGKIAAEQPNSSHEERGPRDSAPVQALDGFLRKHNASRNELITEGGYYILRRNLPPILAQQVLLEWLPRTLAVFSWPKSMRWGQSGDFTWVRPLRRITCLLDGEVIPFTLGPVTAGNETEGHRIHGPGPFAVSSADDWEKQLFEHGVIVDPVVRRQKIKEGMDKQAAALGLTVVPDDALLDEVTGLIEWPIPLIGSIDEKFMDLPPEVRELSMKINQKYFALRDATGTPAPYFAFVANLDAKDNGTTIIGGNERVLRARLADARHFWDLDLKTPLEGLLDRLVRITFHAKIGTQYDRAKRIEELSGRIAESLYADGQEIEQARLAGRWCKVDLVTGMVGEFPELQGIMGGYYADPFGKAGQNGIAVGAAIRTHYQPKGPSDTVPTGVVAVSVALADKLDTLMHFFAQGEKPTGSSDPYALRRAALGVIRIILENNLSQIDLRTIFASPIAVFTTGVQRSILLETETQAELLAFIMDRLRVKLRTEGKRFDILDAVFAVRTDGNLIEIMKRVDAITTVLETHEGADLVAAYKRAANILRSEGWIEAKATERPDQDLFVADAERGLASSVSTVRKSIADNLAENNDLANISVLAHLRAPIDKFFAEVTVNDKDPSIRENRLKLLAMFRSTFHYIADFSKLAA